MYGNSCFFIFFFIVDVSYFYQGGKFPFISKKYIFSQRTKKHNVIFILVVVESCNKFSYGQVCVGFQDAMHLTGLIIISIVWKVAINFTESVQIISRNSI